MKKLLAILLVSFAAIGLVSCNSNETVDLEIPENANVTVDGENVNIEIPSTEEIENIQQETLDAINNGEIQLPTAEEIEAAQKAAIDAVNNGTIELPENIVFPELNVVETTSEGQNTLSIDEDVDGNIVVTPVQ